MTIYKKYIMVICAFLFEKCKEDLIMSEAINREDLYLFQTGKARQAYLTFGCHYQKQTKNHRFTVWAPNAKSVSVVGDFNFWNPLAHPMKGDKD